jgi:hypothetical protein
MAEANIRAVITAQDRASAVLAGVGNNFHKLLKVSAAAVAAAGVAVTAFGVSSVKSFMESENAISQMNAVLKSTGGVAGVTSDQALDLANSLQKVTQFSDEAILGGQNLLLTFTNIGKDIFPEATETMLNMSQALGQDVKSSAIQLGKALQDPILGVTALRRVGVNFNEAQTEVIKNLVRTGRSAEAQRLILKELRTEFGGSAKAAGKTFAGQLKILGNQFDEVKEQVGGLIAGALVPLGVKISGFLTSEGFTQWLVNLYTWFGKAWTAIKEVALQVYGFLKPSLDALWATVETQLLPVLKRWYEEILVPLAPYIGGALVGALWLFINALNMIVKVLAFIQTQQLNFVNFLQSIPQLIQNAWNAVVNDLKWLQENWMSVFGYMVGFIATLPIKLPLLMLKSMLGMVNVIRSINWVSVFSGIGGAFLGVINWIWHLWIGLFHRVKDINWGEAIKSFTKSMANGLIGMLEGGINGALSGIPGSPKVRLPRFAGGVQGFAGGAAIVGERGAEIVQLPRGSNVIPNNQISRELGGGNISINVNVGMYAGSEMEKRKVAESLFEALRDAASTKNMSVSQMMGI